MMPLRSSSLTVLLPFIASQINFVPSSPNWFPASEIFVIDVLSRIAAAKLFEPSTPRLFLLRLTCKHAQRGYESAPYT